MALLMATLLIDRENVVKKGLIVKDANSKKVLEFYESYLVDSRTSLASKTKALKILPFFLVDEVASHVVK